MGNKVTVFTEAQIEDYQVSHISYVIIARGKSHSRQIAQ